MTDTMVKAEVGEGVNEYLERIQDEYDCNKTKATTLALEGAWAHGWKLPGDDNTHRLADAEPTHVPDDAPRDENDDPEDL